VDSRSGRTPHRRLLASLLGRAGAVPGGDALWGTMTAARRPPALTGAMKAASRLILSASAPGSRSTEASPPFEVDWSVIAPTVADVLLAAFALCVGLGC
jgi:hypothetical protein